MPELGVDISSSNSHFIRSHVTQSLSQSKLNVGVSELSAEEKRTIQELKRRDSEVRRHEQSHKAAAGRYASGVPKYEYMTGPDGKQYAVGGEVQIDTAEVDGDPKATIRKAQAIKRAALAPKSPSTQDRSVAAQARQMEMKARREISKQSKEEMQSYNRTGESLRNQQDVPLVDVLV